MLNNDNATPLDASKTNQKYSLLEKTAKADETYLDNIYFIGDSRTVGLSTYTAISKDHLLGEVGMNLSQAINKKVVPINAKKIASIPDAVGIYVPDMMIINFGINGIGWTPVEEMIKEYEALLDALKKKSPESIVIVQSVLPVSSFYQKNNPKVTNKKIDTLNLAILEMAKKREIYFMNTAEVMLNKNNNLKDEYTSDGLHFNKDGNEKIMDYVLSHTVIPKN
ncbi:MAG: GDSL-type esterase/lipase family protein [Oscillospiraceae bacterium]